MLGCSVLCEDSEESEILNELVDECDELSVLDAASCLAILRLQFPCIVCKQCLKNYLKTTYFPNYTDTYRKSSNTGASVGLIHHLFYTRT